MSGTVASATPPVPTSSTHDPHANTAQTTVEELLAYMKRRKILWELHLCVSSSSAIQETGNHVSVVLDGDTEGTPIRVMTLVGPIYPNVHYALIFVPPAGYYVIGALNNAAVRHMPAILLGNDVDVDLSSTGNPIQIGDSSGQNMVFDGNEIQARTNGAASTLNFNISGGNVNIGNDTANINLSGAVALGNEVFGNVSITPVANTPTSAVVTYATLDGTGLESAWVCPNTSVPETGVLMFSFSSLSATSITVWVVRVNTTSTSLSYQVKRAQ